MKKIIILFIALVAVVTASLCACENSALVIPRIPDVRGSILPDESEPTVGAAIEIDNQVTYYEDITEAWEIANTRTDTSVYIQFYQDWTGVNGNYGKSRDHKGFELDALTISVRYGKSNSLYIDLNGHTVNPGLDEDRRGRCFRYMGDYDAADTNTYGGIYIMNGTLTGGKANEGGAVYIYGNSTDFYFENVTVTGCSSTLTGGGIYYFVPEGTLHLSFCNITGNKSGGIGGGVYVGTSYLTEAKLAAPMVELLGDVIIKDNKGSSDVNDNLYIYNLPSTVVRMSYLVNTHFITSGSDIGITFSRGRGQFSTTSGVGNKDILTSVIKSDVGLKVKFVYDTTTDNGCEEYTGGYLQFTD